MDKKIKELIAKNKISDDQILKALQALKPPAEDPSAEDPKGGTPEDPKKKDQEVEQESTSTKEILKPPEKKTPGETGVEKPEPEVLSQKELDALIKKKVEEALANQPKAQPTIFPTIDNPNRPKQYKVLKKG